MNDTYFFSIVKTIKRVYVYPHQTNKILSALWNKAHTGRMTEDEALMSFIGILSKLKKMPTGEKKDFYKTTSALEIIGNFQPKNVLDIGAGQGIIVQSIGESYGLPKDSIFAMDLQPINNQNVTVLEYVNGLVPLPDKSVDLIILMSVLHHIDPGNRIKVIEEVSRLLSDEGRLFIREHDDNKTREFRIFLQFIHYIWYTANNETHDPLHLMTKTELSGMLAEFGLYLDQEKKGEGKNPQRIYENVFIKRKID